MSTERDRIRAEILKTRPVQSKVITFFGQKIELKQLTLGAIIDIGSKTEERQAAMIDILIKYAFIPGTQEKVFEDADADSLKALPFGGDFLDLTKAVEELNNLTFPTTGEDSKLTAKSPGSSALPTS